ncbi:MAG TPA: 3-deoxy-7-phosphoheptulonate synthase [Candidatus Nanoarchaeia archaeon]|nr:3-deoxy-7-phosphoheptulonate synthase [Candidatus Nanoarchaeia archaeon]
MIIVLKSKTTKEEINTIGELLKKRGLKPVEFNGDERTVIHVLGDVKDDSVAQVSSISCVEKVVRILKPFKLASKEHHSQKTVIKIGDVSIGNGDFVVIAGPCSIESEEQIMESAEMLKKLGIKIMRASAFKPRTSPYDFQGLGIKGLKLLKKVRDKTGILVETEVMDVRDVAIAAEYVDVLRVGARNMQNYDLLKELGKINKPVILKRGMSATINEFIMAAEYILYHGNRNVILCERGIRTFETAYRNTLDIGAVAVLKNLTHLPVIVDPSHAAGNRELIGPLSKASAAAGADGLLVEAHPNPQKALSDAAQSLYPEQLSKLLDELKPVCAAVGKRLN